MMRMLLAVVIATVALGQVQPEAAVRTSERVAGPVAVGGRTFRVALQVKQLRGGGTPDPDFSETVSLVQIRDEAGRVQFQRSLPCKVLGDRFEETTAVHAEILKGRVGSGLLLTYGVAPSTPLGGQSWQVFGVVNGELRPFSGPISADGDLASQSSGSITNATWDETLKADVLNFRVWTGNFFAIVPLRVDWTMGSVRPAYRCWKMTGSGPVEACRFRIEAERRPEEGLTFVRLFQETDEKVGIPLHAVIKKDSVIEFVEAEAALKWEESAGQVGLSVSEDIWLKVRVDGKEGWVHSQEDFLAVGLPQAG
jgi:hypothetical protein